MIALIPHASKIILRILGESLKNFLLCQISDKQNGFVPGKETSEQILNVRQIIEKTRQFNVKLLMCFEADKKAFDGVTWSKLWNILAEVGTPMHLILLIEILYKSNTATVRVNHTLSDIIRATLEEWKAGIAVGGRKINNL